MTSNGFAIRRMDYGGVRRLELEGELDMATADDVRGALDDCADAPRVVVDTTRLEFVDSMGVGALVEGRQEFGDRFELIPGQATDRVLTLTGLRNFFGLGNP